MLQTEVNNYAALYPLQCVAIPRIHGFYSVWGILHIIMLEPVVELSRSQQLSPGLRQKNEVGTRPH